MPRARPPHSDETRDLVQQFEQAYEFRVRPRLQAVRARLTAAAESLEALHEAETRRLGQEMGIAASSRH
jgi:hypothetical protein